MLMIIAHHFAIHGIQHDLDGSTAYVVWRNGTLINKIADCLYVPGGKIGVGIFFMLTGYFLIKKHSFSLRKVILESTFYGSFNSIIYIVFLCAGVLPVPENKLNSLLIPTVLALFNPAIGGVWWFISAYVMLIMLLPFLNRFLNCLTKKGYLIFLVVFWIVLYSIGSLGTPYSSVMMGIFFYSLGGFIRLFGSRVEPKNLIICIAFFVVFWIIDAYCIYLNASNISTFSGIKVLAINQIQISICWPICAILLFKIFEAINVNSYKLVNKIASTTFGIYLIHDFGPFRNLIWYKILNVDLLYANRLFPFYAFLVVIAVFIVCSIIDLIRQALFEPKMLRITASLIDRFKKNYMR